ncbi:Methylated-DNA--protein-cysteine methyltransferase [subsurface metagenome]
MHDFLKLKLSPYWIGAVSEKGKLVKISVCYSQKDLYRSLGAALKEQTGSSSFLKRLKQDLLSYWQGERVDFTNYSLKLDRYSSFQRKVWRLTQEIPYGEVRSYKWIAKRLGSKGYRAVFSPIPGICLNSSKLLFLITWVAYMSKHDIIEGTKIFELLVINCSPQRSQSAPR